MHKEPRDYESLTKVAQVLGPLCEETVVVGGSIWSFLTPEREPLTSSGVTTLQIVSWADYDTIASCFSLAGLREVSGRPHYRRWAGRDLFVELFATAKFNAGVSNPWHTDLRSDAPIMALPDGSSIRLIDPVHFLAARLYDIMTWGAGDLYHSEEVRDVLLLVLGSQSLSQDLAQSSQPLRAFVQRNLQSLIEVPGIEDVIASVVNNAGLGTDQANLLNQRLQELLLSISASR